MKTLQEIFTIVIEAGYYRQNDTHILPYGSPGFMCCALDAAKHSGLVTAKERDKTKASINTYISYLNGNSLLNSATLFGALVGSNILPRDKITPDLLLATYSNWKTRPRYKKKDKQLQKQRKKRSIRK